MRLIIISELIIGTLAMRHSSAVLVDLQLSSSQLRLHVRFPLPMLRFLSLTLSPDGGTESIAITAGETKNPTKNLPRVVKNVFWRILLFYVLSVLLIGLNVPYNYSGLSTKTSSTSPFTIVFQMAGAKAAGSFINAVILTSVISAGNHALFAGTRLLYSLSVDSHAPKFFGKLNRNKVPWIAVLATSAISGLCFGASFIGAGQLWTWLQNLVGVSNQLAWLAIGATSIRFRGALERQGKTHLLPFKNWTYPWGPWISVVLNIVIILVQGWNSLSPFSAIDFVSYYIELPVMLVMYLGWKWFKKTKIVSYEKMDLETDVYVISEEDLKEMEQEKSARGKLESVIRWIF
jgi:AAT family amino acid transporter